jgi:hypothetical protein
MVMWTTGNVIIIDVSFIVVVSLGRLDVLMGNRITRFKCAGAVDRVSYNVFCVLFFCERNVSDLWIDIGNFLLVSGIRRISTSGAGCC